MSKLFIFGNGFDLHHGIESKYEDFKNWLYKKDKKMFCEIEKYNRNNIFIEDLKSNWLNIENALSINPEFNDKISINLEIDNIVRVFHGKFHEWVLEISKDIDKVKKLFHLDKNNYYLTFNYINTLENIYKIPRIDKDIMHIYHIHGFAESLDSNIYSNQVNTIVFGKKDNMTNASFEGVFRYRFSKETNRIINLMRERFLINKTLNNISEILIYGLSIDDRNGDLDYILFIRKIIPNILLRIFYFDEQSKYYFEMINNKYNLNASIEPTAIFIKELKLDN